MAAKSQTESEKKVPYEEASAALLARQPSELPASEEPKPEQGWGALCRHLESRLASLRTWRMTWWTENWSDLSQYILPRRSIWLTQSAGGMPTPNSMSRGQPINSAIVDPTATYATRVCAGGLMSGLASPSRPWFKMIPAGMKVSLDAAGRAWLDEAEDIVYSVLAGSNFYNSFAQECEDLVVFGTAPCLIYEDEKDIIRLYNPCIGEYYLGSDATNRVDTFDRTFLMTVAQIVSFFTLEACPEIIQNLWKEKGTGLDKEFIVAHSIEPNFEVEDSPMSKVPGKFTWREVYWLWSQGAEKPLSIRGFIDQPFTAARWTTQSNDSYGRSAGMDVLPDVIQLQVMTRRMAEAIEKMVRPPLLADMQLKNQPSSILPGHVTYVANLGPNSGMRSIYDVNPDVNHLANLILAIEKRVQTGLFNDLFLMLEQIPQGRMTAYEVAQKMQEKLQVLGPVIEGLIMESLKPKLKRIFSILQRKGMIPPPPPSLRNTAIDLEFVSILALAQKGAATGGLERLIGIIGNMAPVFPTVKDNLDSDIFIREFNSLLGNPEKVLFGPEVVDKNRQAAAQEMQQQKAQATMAQGADTAKTGAQAAQVLSQTQVGSGADALSQILGTGGGAK